MPTALISTPATAGPSILASWKLPEFSPTALRTRLFGTISLTKVCRAGLSTTVARPQPESDQVDLPDLHQPGQRQHGEQRRPARPITDWVIISSRRLG